MVSFIAKVQFKDNYHVIIYMEQVKISDIRSYNEMVGAETLHPLVGMVDFNKLPPILFNTPQRMFGYYAIYLKGKKYTKLHYGDSFYDYSEGALVFFAPGQVAGSEADGLYHQVQGHVLLFHPDLLAGTPLQSMISQYTYFSYNINEALFPSEREKLLIVDIFEKIDDELHTASPDLIIITDYIKVVLDYCLHAYDRQFHAMPMVNNDVLTRFEQLCQTYYERKLPIDQGLLTVQYCADQLCLSVNYFSDLIRKATGLSPQKHIMRHTLLKAKELLLTTSYPIKEIAYALGFQQPQNFTNWFKKQEGVSPNVYKVQNTTNLNSK